MAEGEPARQALVLGRDPHDVRMLQHGLARCGYRVTLAADATAARHADAAGAFSVVVVTPDVDASELAELTHALRTPNAVAGPRILQLCDAADPATIGRHLARGADELLLRPLTPGALAERLALAAPPARH